MSIRVTFLGSGNAFAAGGRAHACILIEHDGGTLLLDCGGASLPAITRRADPGRIDAIAVTHLHGDHFGGIPFLMDEQKWNGRTKPITIGGPPSLRARLDLLASGFGMDLASTRYDWKVVVLGPQATALAGAEVTAHPVHHSPDAEPHGLRVRVGGKLIAYSGDATWTKELVDLADGADLFISECTWFSKRDPVHLNAMDLKEHGKDLRARRVVLTHLGSEALAHRAELPYEAADDGTALEL
jgi:ribonuclease BN (tRNA processing enzyme)